MAEVTWEDLKTAIEGNGGVSLDTTKDALITQVFNVGKAWVENYIGVQTTVDEATKNEAVILAGLELFKRRQNPQGAAQNLNEVGAPLPFRLSKDPYVTVREILNPFLVVGF
jgi:hypothetical protein